MSEWVSSAARYLIGHFGDKTNKKEKNKKNKTTEKWGD